MLYRLPFRLHLCFGEKESWSECPTFLVEIFYLFLGAKMLMSVNYKSAGYIAEFFRVYSPKNLFLVFKAPQISATRRCSTLPTLRFKV